MAPKNSRKSPIVMTEKVLAEFHEIYSDKENGLIEIAKSLGSYGSKGLYHLFEIRKIQENIDLFTLKFSC